MDPAGTDMGMPSGHNMGMRGSGKDNVVVIPRASKHSACKKIIRSEILLLMSPL